MADMNRFDSASKWFLSWRSRFCWVFAGTKDPIVLISVHESAPETDQERGTVRSNLVEDDQNARGRVEHDLLAVGARLRRDGSATPEPRALATDCARTSDREGTPPRTNRKHP